MELTLTLSAPCPYFENSLAELYIVSPTAMEQYGANDNRAAIGTAPYYVESYNSGVGFILKANPEYYLYERKPVIETVEAKIIGDENTKLMAMLNGELDIYTFGAVESFYNLQDYGYEGILLQGNGNSSPLFFNAKMVPEFEIYEVRKAMNRFIDLEGINQIMYDGMGLVQTSLWTIGSSGEVPWPEGFYYDFDEGMALMNEAGIDPASMHFNAKIIESGADLFVTIQGHLAKAGITMEVEPLEAAANFTFLMNGEWTITAGNSGYMDSAPYGPWNFILKPEHLIKEVWCDIYDPELYQLMLDTHAKMSSALTWDEMLVHCRELTRLEQEDYGAMPGVQGTYFAAINPELKGVTFITENHAIQMYYMYY